MTIRQDVKTAKKVLDNFRLSERIAPDVPTPERLRQSDDAYRFETFSQAVEIEGQDGRPTVATIERRRVRMDDAPLARLATRGMLAPGDRLLNMALKVAGDRYYQLWFNGTPSLCAMDPSRPVVSGGGGPSSLWSTERRLHSYSVWLAASLRVYPKHRAVVDGVTLHEREPVELGRVASGCVDVGRATAVALDHLRLGLWEIANHFGMLERVEGDPRLNPRKL